jgi:hypothetical protein
LPVAIPSKRFSSDSCGIRSISVNASTPATFRSGTENGAGSTARTFQSQLFLKNFLDRRHARQEVLCKYSSTGKRTLLKKCRKLRTRGHGDRPVRGASLQDKVSEFAPSGLGVLEHPRCNKSSPAPIEAHQSPSSPQCRKEFDNEVSPSFTREANRMTTFNKYRHCFNNCEKIVE